MENETQQESRAKRSGLWKAVKTVFLGTGRPRPWQRDRLDGLYARVNKVFEAVLALFLAGLVLGGVLLLQPDMLVDEGSRALAGIFLILGGTTLAVVIMRSDEKDRAATEAGPIWGALREAEGGGGAGGARTLSELLEGVEGDVTKPETFRFLRNAGRRPKKADLETALRLGRPSDETEAELRLRLEAAWTVMTEWDRWSPNFVEIVGREPSAAFQAVVVHFCVWE